MNKSTTIRNFCAFLLLNGCSCLNINYKLYTRDNPTVPIDMENENLIDTKKALKILIHGWLENASLKIYANIKLSYLIEDDCNVLLIDWSKQNGEYYMSKIYAKHIGNLIADHLSYIFAKFDKIHIVGFGMGAHIAGFIGKRLSTLYFIQVRRITGIDPVVPLFNNTPPTERLSSKDAKIVDVVHCDGHRVTFGDSMGTVDFFPNGGLSPQPRCNDANYTILHIFYLSVEEVFCSHVKCRDYFLASVSNKTIYASKCDSYMDFNAGLCNDNEVIVFGEHMPENAQGNYYLNITADLM